MNKLAWTELEKLLRSVLNEIAQQLDSDAHALVADFIENREYGVAYDWIESLANRGAIELGTTAKTAMGRAKQLMDAGTD